VTFLFTDIEGSTRLWEDAPDAMRAALERHDEILRTAIDTHAGFVFSTGGDGLAAAFARAGDAVAAATDAQALLAAQTWPERAPLRVRMGLHTGETVERDGDYFGPTVNRAARLMAIAHGGQVVCSNATAALLDPSAGLVGLGEHRLRDLGAPEVVYQVGQGTFPTLRSVDTVPTNLPTMRTELIGRSSDIADLAALVSAEQLVTLTGVGGVGKTRLALGVAGAVASDYPDGCWLVELAPVADGAEVAKTVAAAVAAPATEAEGLARYLADRNVLIVLDNCEHVLEDAADLVDGVLAVGPDVHVIATSREPLGVDGEQVRRVGSLAVPGLGSDADAVAASAAGRLFVARASSVMPGFAVNDANGAAVAEICRHLDGIPLAIELAAARVRAMPPAEIAARLSERFRLLAGGSRRAQERHRTLAATVGWSYDLLTDEERGVFRRLSVFPASFDLTAAEAVAGGDGADAVECVVRLVDRSLVQYDAEVGRYRLLETLRQYGADRLAEAGETDGVRARHAAYFSALVTRLAPDLHDARYTAAVATLIAEVDNIRAVADWFTETGAFTELAHLCRDAYYFLAQHAPVDAASWYGHLVRHHDMLDRASAVDAIAEMAFLLVNNMGDYDGAQALARRTVEEAAAGGFATSPLAWMASAMVEIYTTRDPAALEYCRRAIATAEARHRDDHAAIAQGMAATLLAESGQTEAAHRFGTEALERAKRTGQPTIITAAIVTLGGIPIWSNVRPDFAAAYEILASHEGDVDIESGATTTLWLDLQWGTVLMGLGRPGAVARLAGAIAAADRHAASHAVDMAIRLLAVTVARLGLRAEAAMLGAYADANLQPYRMRSPMHGWVSTTLEEALDALPDRAVHEAAGASASRREVLALVARLNTTVE
jgi:predicted ATPase